MMSPRMYRLRMNRTTPHKYPTNFRNSNFKRRKRAQIPSMVHVVGGWALVRTEIDTMRVAKHN